MKKIVASEDPNVILAKDAKVTDGIHVCRDDGTFLGIVQLTQDSKFRIAWADGGPLGAGVPFSQERDTINALMVSHNSLIFKQL